jgi:hypothetical protein
MLYVQLRPSIHALCSRPSVENKKAPRYTNHMFNSMPEKVYFAIPCAWRTCHPMPPSLHHRIVLALHSGIRLAHPLPSLPHRASNCTILNKQVSTHSHRHPTLPQSHPNRARRCNSPVRPLLVQHAMSTVPAANRLAALERDVLVTIAAFVVYGAGVGVDDGGVGRAGLCRVVLLGGHGCAFDSYGYE